LQLQVLLFSSDIICKICLLNVTGTDTNTRCGFSVVRIYPLIINGQSTTHGQWPWHAALYRHQDYLCGGSLVSTRTIITGMFMYSPLVKINVSFQMEKLYIDLSQCVCVGGGGMWRT
jgi:hypothetical protein